MKMKIKDSSEDIGFITDEDPWSILSSHYGEKFSDYRNLWDRASTFNLELKYPLQLDFELNNTCNYRCPSCTWSIETNENIKLFPLDVFKKIITDGVQKGLKALDMSFVNEPLLRRDLPEFIKYARDAGILDIAFNTNALLLTEKMTEELIESGLTRIQFSMDAYSENIYNIVRPGGNFKKVVHNILYFIKRKNEEKGNGLLTAVSFLKMSTNEIELNDFVDYWQKRVNYIVIREYLSPYGTDSEFYHEKKKLFLEMRHKASHFRCNKPWQRLVIRADGTVLPCCTFYATKLPVGNIYASSIDEIWNAPKMMKLRALHKDGKYYMNKVCLECAICSTG